MNDGRPILRRGDLALPLLAFGAVAIGLALDSRATWLGHIAADLWTLACFLAARRFATPRERRDQLLCVVLATAGEAFLCFGWGLYEYRFANLPVFVPLGHSLIFLAGLRLARFAPRGSTLAVSALGAASVLVLAALGRDRLSLLLFPLFVACLASQRTRRLHATMFALSFVVEVAGTGVHSWRWVATDPWLSLPLTNPPLCAGAFYCALDVLVASASRLRIRAAGARSSRAFARAGAPREAAGSPRTAGPTT